MNETHLLATGRQGSERYFGLLQELMQQATKCPLTGEYSERSVYVYRAPDMRGGYSYARENPCFYIFLDKKPGSVDVFALSHLMLAVQDSIVDLFGSLAYSYAVGIGSGATFLNSYVCRWNASRFAAAVVIGGTIPKVRVL